MVTNELVEPSLVLYNELDLAHLHLLITIGSARNSKTRTLKRLNLQRAG